jgi:hypothetical protein
MQTRQSTRNTPIKTNNNGDRVPILPLAPWAKALDNDEETSPRINKKPSKNRRIIRDTPSPTKTKSKSPFQSPRATSNAIPIETAPLRRSKRVSKAPERMEDLTFIPGANNGYTRGRRIDPGFSIRTAGEYHSEASAIRRIRNEGNLKGFVSDKIHYMSKEEIASEEELTDAETTEEEQEYSDLDLQSESEIESDSADTQIARIQQKRLHNSSAYRGKVNTYSNDRDTDHFSEEEDNSSDSDYSCSEQEDIEDSDWESESASEEEEQVVYSCPKKYNKRK